MHFLQGVSKLTQVTTLKSGGKNSETIRISLFLPYMLELTTVSPASSLVFTAPFISSVCFVLRPHLGRWRTVPVSSNFFTSVERNCPVSRFHLNTPLEIDFIPFCTTSFRNNTLVKKILCSCEKTIFNFFRKQPL